MSERYTEKWLDNQYDSTMRPVPHAVYIDSQTGERLTSSEVQPRNRRNRNEGAAMKDLKLKWRILTTLIAGAIAEYKETTEDLDAAVCCDGGRSGPPSGMCGCQGMTYRDLWEADR